MYDRYCKIRDLKGLKDADIATKADITKSTFTDWKNGRSKPKDDKMKKIAEALDVPRDYLVGEITWLNCPECNFCYDMLVENEFNQHAIYHEKYFNILNKYTFFMNSKEAEKLRSDSIFKYTSYDVTLDEKLNAFENYLKAEFSLQLLKNGLNDDGLDFKEFSKYEVEGLQPSDSITEDFLSAIREKYGVKSKEYYSDYSTAKIAQEIKDNKDLRLLFDAAQNSSSEDLQMVHQMLLALKRKERGE